ncbi:hypothetical protein BDP27DRAFT_1178820, partial [Rhodocollybia butyracea]
GILNLYIGMPVILQGRNIATEIGITNGAKGFIRSIDLSSDVNGCTFARGAIVEFPESKVKLDGLPQGFFPIVPRTWKFSTVIDVPGEGKVVVRISRTQLPFQAAFAVTGHSAQGQTLPVVLCNLHEGGWA